MNRSFLTIACFFGAVAIIAGALLAHALKQRMPDIALDTFNTAVRYQFYHVFALLFVGLISKDIHEKWIYRAGILFIVGIMLFSGSLYIISTLITLGRNIPVLLGICTPLGGLTLILGWIFLGLGVSKGRFT